MNDEKDDLLVGAIVQLDPEKTANPMFAGCLMTVTEVRSWGVQGYVQGLGENGEMAGQAYYRAKFGTFAVTRGMAQWIVGDNAPDDGKNRNES